MNSFDQFVVWLNKLHGLPAVVLTMLWCIAVGYVLRALKKFPNQAIPLFIIVWGGIAMLILSDKSEITETDMWEWFGRNFATGNVVGMLAWIVHKCAIKKLEDWVVAKFPSLGETAIFAKDPDI